ncbi:MAG: transglutaminase domain-containing protein, partial [Maricaulaceae bacterium]
EDPEPKTAEALTPNQYASWDYVTYSSMGSWAEVAEWAVDVFDIDTALPSETEDAIERIQIESDDLESQITQVARYVQDNIRYVGDEVGLGSHVPRTPREVVRRGFGDCKDVAVLLAAMLERIGASSHVVLTHTSRGWRLPQIAPSPYSFNHAIVAVDFRGERYWIDPTYSHQGGTFPNIAELDYGFGLIVQPGETALSAIEAAPPNSVGLQVEETFELPGREEGDVLLNVRTTMRGRDADDFRWRLAGQSVASISNDYLTYYQSLYPGIEAVSALVVEDDRDANLIVTNEHYRLSYEDFTKDDLINWFPMRFDAVLGLFNELTDVENRTSPIGLGAPIWRRHIVRLTNTGMAMLANEDVLVESPYYRFSVKENAASNALTVTADLETFAHQMPAAAAADYAAFYNTVENSSYLDINLETSAVLAALGAFTALDEDVQEQIFGVGFLVIFYSVMALGAVISLRADMQFAGQSVLHPVRLSKFIILSILTLGLYHILWFWKNWRWSKENDPRSISPFGRSLFSILYYLPFYTLIREHSPGRTIPAFVGGLLALIYFIWAIVGRVGDRFSTWSGFAIIDLFLFIWAIPLVLAVNRLNAEHEDAIRYNSRWTFWTFCAAAFGLLALGLVIVGLIAQMNPDYFA